MVQGSSAAMTAQALWCWQETRPVVAPQTGLMTGAHLRTGSHHGCPGTPTGFTMSRVTTTAACGLTIATSTLTIGLLADVATTGPQELVRSFKSDEVYFVNSIQPLNRYPREHKVDKV